MNACRPTLLTELISFCVKTEMFSPVLGDKYINGEIIPCQYPTYQPKQSNRPRNKSKAYVRQRDGPPERRRPRKEAAPESAS